MNHAKRSAEDLVHELADRVEELRHQAERDQEEIKKLRGQVAKLQAAPCSQEHVTPEIKGIIAAHERLERLFEVELG